MFLPNLSSNKLTVRIGVGKNASVLQSINRLWLLIVTDKGKGRVAYKRRGGFQNGGFIREGLAPNG